MLSQYNIIYNFMQKLEKPETEAKFKNFNIS